MIYVTVGTAIHGSGFDRLIRAVDEICPRLDDEIMAQIGSSMYIPKHMKWVRYVPFEESLRYFQDAKLIIGHSGSGTILNALSMGTPLIVVPRRAQFCEHDDDHQVEIAKSFEAQGWLKVVYEVEDLEGAIHMAIHEMSERKVKPSQHRPQLIERIKGFLQTVHKQK